MKLYNKENLKNSRIFFDKNPPKFMMILIYFTLFIILLSVLASSKLRKNYIVKANGQVSDSEISYLSSNINGSIIEIKAKEGDFVKEGDLVLVISNWEENTQREEYKKALEENIKKIEILERYRKSLDDNENHLEDSGVEQEYYGKVEYYLQSLDSEKKNQSFTEEDMEKKKNKLSEKISEKNKIYNKLEGLEENKNYYKNLIKYYENLAYEISNLESQLAELRISELPDEKLIKDKEIELKTKKDEYRENNEVLKLESESELKYQESKSKIESLESEIEGLREEIVQLERQNSNYLSQANQIYFQFINEIGNELKNIEKADNDLKMNISILEKRDQNYEILAPKTGHIHYINSIKEGVNIQINQTIAEISKLQDHNYYIETLINVSDISKVKKGQDVEVALIGVNTYKYGTLKGKLKSIENGLFTVQTQDGNSSFYKAIIEVKDKKLVKGRDEIPLLISMPVEARIIYDKESYLDYFLEKISFRN